MRTLAVAFLSLTVLFSGPACVADATSAGEEGDKAVLTTAAVLYFAGPGDELTVAAIAWFVTAVAATLSINAIDTTDDGGFAVTVVGPRPALDALESRASTTPGVETRPDLLPRVRLRTLLMRDVAAWSNKPATSAGSPPWVAERLAEAERDVGRTHQLQLDLPHRDGYLVVNGPGEDAALLTATLRWACESITGNTGCRSGRIRRTNQLTDAVSTRLILFDTTHEPTRTLDLARPLAIASDDGSVAEGTGTETCFGTVQAKATEMDPRLDGEALRDDASRMARLRTRFGENNANMLLICPEHLRTAWLEAFAAALAEHGVTLLVNRWRFGPGSQIFTDFVDRVQSSAAAAAQCGPTELPLNVIEAEDAESAQRLSNKRDATDRIDALNLYAVDEAGHGAIVRHANLNSTVVERFYCL